MKKNIIIMFSGLGSQYFQMGKDLYERNGRFKFWMDRCDAIAQPFLHASFLDVLYGGKGRGEPFDQILYANPALLSIEYGLSRILMEELDVQPDFLLGYSLGEICASVVSGVISLEEGIHLVAALARLVEEKTPPACMLAVLESQELMTACPDLFQNCWVTGNNFQGNFVVSGLPDDIDRLAAGLKQKKILFQVLPVKHGFHTPCIDPIEEEFKQLVRKSRLSPRCIKVISSSPNETVSEANGDYFWDIIRRPVFFEQAIRKTLKRGDSVFIDAGPSGTLATFVKYMLPPESGSLPVSMINQFGNDAASLEKMKKSLCNADIV